MKQKKTLLITALAGVCLLLSSQLCSASPSCTGSDFELMQAIPQGTEQVFKVPNIANTATVWLHMIQHAKKSIAIASLYFQNKSGEALDPIIQAIKKAAQRGVKVRVLTDSMHMSGTSDPTQLFKNIPNITVRKIDYAKVAGGVMHAKYMIVDDANVAVNSANWSWVSLTQIHNVGVRVCSPQLAQTLLGVFNLDWKLALNPDGDKAIKDINQNSTQQWINAERPITVNYQNEKLVIHPAFSPVSVRPNGTDSEISQMLHVIKSAHHTLNMQVMNFTGFKHYGFVGYWGALYSAIANAGQRGVKVHIIVSNWNSIQPNLNFMKSLELLPNVSVKISSIPPLKGRYIPYSRVEHEKYFVADNDISWITTSNWEWGYFYTTRDVALVIQGKKPAATLNQLFNADWNGPYTQTLDISKNYVPPKHN